LTATRNYDYYSPKRDKVITFNKEVVHACNKKNHAQENRDQEKENRNRGFGDKKGDRHQTAADIGGRF